MLCYNIIPIFFLKNESLFSLKEGNKIKIQKYVICLRKKKVTKKRGKTLGFLRMKSATLSSICNSFVTVAEFSTTTFCFPSISFELSLSLVYASLLNRRPITKVVANDPNTRKVLCKQLQILQLK